MLWLERLHNRFVAKQGFKLLEMRVVCGGDRFKIKM
jgi:hypothetical protein